MGYMPSFAEDNNNIKKNTTIPKSNRKIVKTETKSIPLTRMYDCALSSLGTRIFIFRVSFGSG